MRNWLRAWRKPASIDPASFDAALAQVAIAGGRDPDDLQRLRQHVAWFLARKTITGAAGFEPDAAFKLRLAIQACLPLIRPGTDALAPFHQLIVYPGQFRVRRHEHHDDSEVVTEYDDDLAGEAWSDGPIILSAADIEQDLAEPFGGLNVVVHEIAHKLDMADGLTDGVPLLADLAQRREWKRVMGQAFAQFASLLDNGDAMTLDPYAAESPEEFFAVMSEYYFSAPDLLLEQLPQVFGQLSGFYGPVPMPGAG